MKKKDRKNLTPAQIKRRDAREALVLRLQRECGNRCMGTVGEERCPECGPTNVCPVRRGGPIVVLLCGKCKGRLGSQRRAAKKARREQQLSLAP